MDPVTQDTSYQLTAEDRCDVCQAQAYVHVAMELGDLMFCFHHWKESEPKLGALALTITDESARLLAR